MCKYARMQECKNELKSESLEIILLLCKACIEYKNFLYKSCLIVYAIWECLLKSEG